MGRIFKDCFEMIREMDRELKVSGITVPVNHYQTKNSAGTTGSPRNSSG